MMLPRSGTNTNRGQQPGQRRGNRSSRIPRPCRQTQTTSSQSSRHSLPPNLTTYSTNVNDQENRGQQSMFQSWYEKNKLSPSKSVLYDSNITQMKNYRSKHPDETSFNRSSAFDDSTRSQVNHIMINEEEMRVRRAQAWHQKIDCADARRIRDTNLKEREKIWRRSLGGDPEELRKLCRQEIDNTRLNRTMLVDMKYSLSPQALNKASSSNCEHKELRRVQAEEDLTAAPFNSPTIRFSLPPLTRLSPAAEEAHRLLKVASEERRRSPIPHADHLKWQFGRGHYANLDYSIRDQSQRSAATVDKDEAGYAIPTIHRVKPEGYKTPEKSVSPQFYTPQSFKSPAEQIEQYATPMSQFRNSRYSAETTIHSESQQQKTPKRNIEKQNRDDITPTQQTMITNTSTPIPIHIQLDTSLRLQKHLETRLNKNFDQMSKQLGLRTMESAEERTVEAVQPTGGDREDAAADGMRTEQINSPVVVTPRQKTVPLNVWRLRDAGERPSLEGLETSTPKGMDSEAGRTMDLSYPVALARQIGAQIDYQTNGMRMLQQAGTLQNMQKKFGDISFSVANKSKVVVPLTPEEKLSRYLLTDKYLHVLGEYYKFKYEASMKFIVNSNSVNKKEDSKSLYDTLQLEFHSKEESALKAAEKPIPTEKFMKAVQSQIECILKQTEWERRRLQSAAKVAKELRDSPRVQHARQLQPRASSRDVASQSTARLLQNNSFCSKTELQQADKAIETIPTTASINQQFVPSPTLVTTSVSQSDASATIALFTRPAAASPRPVPKLDLASLEGGDDFRDVPMDMSVPLSTAREPEAENDDDRMSIEGEEEMPQQVQEDEGKGEIERDDDQESQLIDYSARDTTESTGREKLAEMDEEEAIVVDVLDVQARSPRVSNQTNADHNFNNASKNLDLSRLSERSYDTKRPDMFLLNESIYNMSTLDDYAHVPDYLNPDSSRLLDMSVAELSSLAKINQTNHTTHTNQENKPRLPLEELDLDASANVVPKENEAKQGLEPKSSETIETAEPVEEENFPVGVPLDTFSGIGLDDSLLDAVQPLSAVVNLDRPLNELSKVATPKRDNGGPAQTLLNDTPRVVGMGEGKGQNEAEEENGTVKEQLSPEEREAAEMFQRVNSASWIKNRTWEIVEEVWRIREEKGYVPSLDDDDEMFDKRPVVPTTASNPLASDILEEQLYDIFERVVQIGHRLFSPPSDSISPVQNPISFFRTSLTLHQFGTIVEREVISMAETIYDMEENHGAQRLMDDIFNKDVRKAIQEREPEEDRMLEWGCRFNATTSAFAYKNVQLHKLNWKTREQVVAELCESVGKEMIEIEAEEASRICVASDIRPSSAASAHSVLSDDFPLRLSSSFPGLPAPFSNRSSLMGRPASTEPVRILPNQNE
ncbi:hypothetical protein WR25_12245 [Diploscapter pachys]|uniref:Uncharacterized protein n=1 Tax=Diploscapter pachys TaxID=2018661 RepID=A0A2A2LED0_9BILA|nr:hypothetical protein WR25_12245 [Diploscapter pachys]